MRIEFAGTVVCTGAGTDSPGEFSYAGSEDEQVSKFLRGRSALVRRRFNEKSQIAFTLFRSLGSVRDAERYCLRFRLDAALPKFGTLVLKSDDGSGAGATSLYLPNAHYVNGTVKYQGMNTWTTYAFSGGAMQTKP